MQSTLNTELLAGMLKNRRADKGLRAVADEIGHVSAATLSRIEQGRIPDMDTFIRICAWLQVPTDTFIKSDEVVQSVSNKEQILAHLRAEKELKPETVNMLARMIDMAYQTK